MRDPVKRRQLRLKLMRALRRTSHRYDRLRVLGMAISTGILLAVPLSGLAQVDLWRGQHRVLFRLATFREGLAGVIVAIAALYVVTFLSNVFAGRLFCGWGCPVGQINRIAEPPETPGTEAAVRRRGHLATFGFAVVLTLSFFVWWTDPRVLWAAAPRGAAIAWSVLLAGIGLASVQARRWRWSFCKSACPIGLYYSFVSPARWYGVHFRNGASSCIECDACDNVCPVDLTPRDLMAPMEAPSALAISGAPGRNHCLECGDCVRACEWMIEKKGDGPVPLLLGYYRGAQRIDPEPATAPPCAADG